MTAARLGLLACAIVLLGLSIGRLAAQDRLPRVGILAEGSPDPNRPEGGLNLVVAGLREQSYVPGTNVVLDTRFAEGRLERLGDLAAELVRLRVDVIVAFSERGAVAARQATTAIPIVMVLGVDPVRRGLIKSLARPGGNVTGLTVDPGAGIIAKRLQVLRQVVPKAQTIAVLTEPALDGDVQRYEPLEEAARQAGVSI